MQDSNPFAQDQYEPNPYAPPATESQPPQSVEGIWRDGKTLIMHKQATLPTNVCIKSNEPTDGYRLKRKLIWHPSWILITILISPLILIILALLMSKRATIYISLTDYWRAKRRSRILTSWVLLAIGMGGMVWGISTLDPRVNGSSGPLMMMGGILLMIIAGMYGLIGSRMVSASKIDKEYVYLKGAHPEFLERFPRATAVR